MIESDLEFYETAEELLVPEKDLLRAAGYLPAECGMDLTVSCVPAHCRRDKGHSGECSVLSEDDVRSVDGEARKMLNQLFPGGLPCAW